METATIAALSAIGGGIVAAAIKFIFDFYLSERIKQRWKAVDITRRYSSPIIRAADDLAGRIENMSRFLDDRQATAWLRSVDPEERPRVPFERYYFVSTVYLIGRLIAWIDILRREEVFLDYSATKEAREFNRHMDLIYQIISFARLTGDDAERSKKNHWIYFYYLSGIGEAFSTKEIGKENSTAISFQEFCRRYRESNRQSDFDLWVKEIECLVVDLTSDAEDSRWERFQMLWFSLDKLLQLLDPKNIRTTRKRSKSVQIPEAVRVKVVNQARDIGLLW